MVGLPRELHKRLKNMKKTVKSQYLRTSVKKLRVFISALKGKKALDTLQQLALQPQQALALVAKTLKSGIYLFEEPLRKELVIENIVADQGPVFKRWRAGSRGNAKKYSKKTAHLTITLAINKKQTKKDGK